MSDFPPQKAPENQQESENERLPESDWLRDIAAGGSARNQATESLFHAYAQRFRQYFQRRGASAADAEELCQEAFIKILRSIDNGTTVEQPRAWLWKVASSVLVDYLRKSETATETIQSSEMLLNAQAANGEDLAEQIGLEECVSRQLKAFALEQPEGTQVLIWACVEQFTAKEIAVLIGRTPDAARQFLSQIRKKVRKLLAICK